MATKAELQAAAKKLQKQQREIRAALGTGNRTDERTSQRDLMARKRKSDRDIQPRPVKDPARREACYLDDKLFLQTYLPDVFYSPFTSSQEQFIVDCGRAIKYGTSKAMAMPRGSGKSTIVKYLQLKYALYRQLKFPLILAATTSKGDQILRDIKAKLRSPTNQYLHEDFPFETSICRYIAPAPSRARSATWGGLPVRVEWGPHHVLLPSLSEGRGDYEVEEYGLATDAGELGPVLMCLGFTSDSLQGLNVYDRRPDFVMLDDLDSRDSLAAEQGVIAGKIEECIDKTVAGLGGPNKRLGRVFICTITSRRSAAYLYTDRDEKPAWDGERIPRIVTWPNRADLWEKYIELRKTRKPTDKHAREACEFLSANFETMHEGAVLSSVYDYSLDLLDDGEPAHLSALHKCYDYIADNGMGSFLTEHQNAPPLERDQPLSLTPDHIMHQCSSGLKQHEIPDDATTIVCGVDIRKAGLEYTTTAWTPDAHGSIVDYAFFDFQSAGLPIETMDVCIYNALHDWKDQVIDTLPYHVDLIAIDEGWKEETWKEQPVRKFCRDAGTLRFVPTKGWSPYRRPQWATIGGSGWHASREGVILFDPDIYKLQVHSGFLTEEQEAGSLRVFESKVRTPHKTFAFQITAEVWEERFEKGWKRNRLGWWKVRKQNHYLDSTALTIVGRVMRGVDRLEPATRVTEKKNPKTAERSQPAKRTPVAIPQSAGTFSRGRW